MSTSLKLSSRLKARVAAAAKKTGKSPHAFMLEAIEAQTVQTEERQRFIADALDAEAEALKTGAGYSAKEVHALMEARARGRRRQPLKVTSWRR